MRSRGGCRRERVVGRCGQSAGTVGQDVEQETLAARPVVDGCPDDGVALAGVVVQEVQDRLVHRDVVLRLRHEVTVHDGAFLLGDVHVAGEDLGVRGRECHGACPREFVAGWRRRRKSRAR
ncbi:hypothetical protein B1R27_04735 [Streptomyces sp. GKU 895]|nr:hypothetical protein B1R27_04735 [Streptomyces sp. GKU 895]